MRTALALAILLAPVGAASANDDPLSPPPNLPPSAPAPAAPPGDGGQRANGIVAEIHLGTAVISLGNLGLGSAVTLSGLEGGLFGGYKIDRVVVGVGLALSRIEGTGVGPANTTVLLAPGIRVAALRSADGRAELFGQFDLGFGHIFIDSPGVTPSNFQLQYQIGPGLRFWMHPQLAFGALAGVRGTYAWVTSNNLSTSGDVTSIFAQLAVTGVY